MGRLQIVKEGDDILRKTCRPVEEITPRILRLLNDMLETMRHANGCGLAGNQVGVLRRVVVIEVEEGQPIELINPKIIAYSGIQEEEEGCLSIPGRYGITRRPKYVTVEALNRKGETIQVNGEGLLARALCHELDHLDGKLFTDCAVKMMDEEPLS